MTNAEVPVNGRPGEPPIVDFDLASHRGRAEQDAAWAKLRAKCPVAWSEDNGGAWITTRYDVVSEVFRNWQVFRSARDVRTTPGPGGSPDFISINAISLVASSSRLVPEELDPPQWLPYRRVFADQLSPRAVAAREHRVKYWVTQFLDDVIESGNCDIVETLTGAVPGAVALEWLGFPQGDWRRISAAMHNAAEITPDSPMAQHYAAELEWTFQRVREEVASRRENPRDDVISLMANFVVDGELAPFEYATGMVNIAIAGGVDTTAAAASSALAHMHHHPDDRRRLIEEPELIDSAIEEFLRLYPPARTHARTVVEDIELDGCQLRKDDRIILSEISACHDETAFTDADKFVVDRFPNRHLAFGLGLHRCPGSHLARMMFKEMLTQVLERIPDYRIVEEGLREYPNWTALGGWSSMPITFTPGTRRL